jgi:hypothetical protein
MLDRKKLSVHLLIGTMAILSLCRHCSAQTVARTARLRVIETAESLVVTQDGRTVLNYVKKSPTAPAGIDEVYCRSGCLHPVNSPAGRTVTQMFPADHAHQHGVFTAWVNTTYAGRTLDFWNLAGGTGRVLHERVVSTFEESARAGFEVDLIHRAVADPPVDILRERWKVTVLPTDGTYFLFDVETRQEALTDAPLVIEHYHYGGFALRGPERWLADKDSGVKKRPDLVREPSDFVNSEGSDRLLGNHQRARWVALTGQLDGHSVTAAVLCHACNFRAPQSARIHPTKPYFCFAPCVDGRFEIDRGHPYQASYRFLITDKAPDAQWIDNQWRAWCEP